MLTREENERLTQVGPGAPAGAMFRRYWLPIATSAQLPAPDGDPLRCKLLGESFVVFRNSDGEVGVLDEFCMHRGVSLALGRVERNGIRCLYHGWKFGVDGAIHETPNNCNEQFRKRMKAPAFPVHEAGGVIWTYIGPRDKQPVFPKFEFMDGPDENRVVLRLNTKANYLQLYEGGADSSHVGILHQDHVAFNGKSHKDDFNLGVMASDDHAPILDVVDTEYGFHYAAKRMGPKDAAGQDTFSVRVTPVVLPFGRIIPAPGSFQYFIFEVPRDDVSTSTYVICYGHGPADREGVKKVVGLHDPRFYNDQDCEFRASWEVNKMNQDRRRMDASFTGFSGIGQEDAVLAVSMGPIVDRTKEHMVPADRAIVHLRARLLQSIQMVEDGGDPIGAHIQDFTSVSSLIDTTVAKSDPWELLLPGNMPLKRAAE